MGQRRSWRGGTDCKSVAVRLSRFESYLTHLNKGCTLSYVQSALLIFSGGLAQSARASALQAEGHRFDSDILHNNTTFYKLFRELKHNRCNHIMMAH